MDKEDARASADALLHHLIAHQGLVPTTNPNDVNGRNVGEFIAALRLRLTEMYQQQG